MCKLLKEELELKDRVYTSYSKAIHFCGNSFIPVSIETLFKIEGENIYDNLPYVYNEETDEYDCDEWMSALMTNCSNDDVEYLQKHFKLQFVYSEVLDVWVLLVPHCGTSYDYVENYISPTLAEKRPDLIVWKNGKRIGD